MPSKPPSKKGKPTVPPKAKSKPNVPSPKQDTPRQSKKFTTAPLRGDNEGEKIVIYGKSGLGKTTLAAQVPGATFVPLDDGARKITNPMTGEPVLAITGVESWDDLRDATRQAPDLLAENGALVIDTATRAQPLAEAWVVENVPVEKGGRAKNLEAFGFGKGYRHVLDQFRLWLTDLEHVIRSGRHVVLLCQLDQSIVPNPAGIDYYEEVPKLIENKQGPVRTEVCEWADHLIRLGYLDVDVSKDDKEARVGKVSGDNRRAIFTGGAQYFAAKSRPINGNRLPPVIGFEDVDDNSLWQFVLEGAVADDRGEGSG